MPRMIRPACLRLRFSVLRNRKPPTARSSGARASSLSDRIWIRSAEPRSAPNAAARPVPKASPPAPANPATKSATAAELCRTIASKRPSAAVRRRGRGAVTISLKAEPKARSMPVRTILTAKSNSNVAPANWKRNVRIAICLYFRSFAPATTSSISHSASRFSKTCRGALSVTRTSMLSAGQATKGAGWPNLL